jgi:hypothetical protein
MVQSQPRQILPETPSWKNPSQKKGWWSGSRWKPWVQNPVPQKKVCWWNKTIILLKMTFNIHVCNVSGDYVMNGEGEKVINGSKIFIYFFFGSKIFYFNWAGIMLI